MTIRFMLTLSLLFTILALKAQTTKQLPVFYENPKRGIYLTVEEFKFNKPSITQGFNIGFNKRTETNWSGTNAYYLERKKGWHPLPKKMFGFSDGIDFYIFHDIEFFLLQREQNDFVTHAYDKINWGTMKNRLVDGWHSFGLIGYGIAAIIKSIKIKKVVNTKFKYVLNFDGILTKTFLDDAYVDWNKFKEMRKLVITRRKIRQVSKPILVNFEGKAYELFPKNYAEIDILAEDKLYEVCLDDTNTCFEFDLIQNIPLTLQVSHHKKKGYRIKKMKNSAILEEGN